MAAGQLKGNLDMLLLAVLSAGPGHGYSVISRPACARTGAPASGPCIFRTWRRICALPSSRCLVQFVTSAPTSGQWLKDITAPPVLFEDRGVQLHGPDRNRRSPYSGA